MYQIVCWVAMLFGIVAGGLMDRIGFRSGVVLSALLYSASAFSVTSSNWASVNFGVFGMIIGFSLE